MALAFGTGIVGLTALEFGWDRVERVAGRLFMGIVLIAVLGLATFAGGDTLDRRVAKVTGERALEVVR